MEKHISIAIDGPVAAGKTTQAKLLAQELGFLYVDTGALYRTIACYMKMNQKTADDIEEVLNSIDMNLVRSEDGTQRMFLGSEEVTGGCGPQRFQSWPRISLLSHLSGSFFWTNSGKPLWTTMLSWRAETSGPLSFPMPASKSF